MTSDFIRALQADDLQRINRILNAFVDEAGARCVMILDRAGRSLTAAGETAGLDEAGFASLAAADYQASDQLAGLLGEQEFTALYHQGIHGSLYLSGLAAGTILAAVFDRRTTLGMVRMKSREVVPQLVQVLLELARRGSRGPGLEAGWSDDAADEIDRLFAG